MYSLRVWKVDLLLSNCTVPMQASLSFCRQSAATSCDPKSVFVTAHQHNNLQVCIFRHTENIEERKNYICMMSTDPAHFWNIIQQ